MLLCMKTTIQLDDQLLLEAKKHAAQTGSRSTSTARKFPTTQLTGIGWKN